MRRPALAWITLVLSVVACNDEPAGPQQRESDPIEAAALPATEASSTDGDASAVVSPAIGSMLADAFSYLAPLPETSRGSEFDATLLHDLVVDVCVPSECGTTSLVSYRSTSSDGSNIIQLETDHYHVNWSPGKLGLPSPAEYRVRVLVAGLELGHTDVQLLTNGAGGQQVLSDETLTILENRTLPVKFHVNRSPLIAAWLIAGRGATAGEVADMLRASFTAQASDVAAVLAYTGFTQEETTSALVHAGYAVADIVAAVAHAFGLDASQAAAAAFAAGLLAGDVGSALVDGLGTSVEDAARALHDAGYSARDVGAWVLSRDAAAGANEAARILRNAGYDLPAVAEFLADIDIVDVEAATAVLLAAGFAMEEVAQWLLDTKGLELSAVVTTLRDAGQPIANVAAWLLAHAPTEVDAITALRAAEYDATAIAEVLATIGRTAEQAADLLVDAGASAFEVGSALVSAYSQTLEQVAQHLEANGFDAPTAFDAAYRTSTEVLGNPADFALRVTLAVMKGAGYAFEDFRDVVIDGVGEWTQENITEALGLSGYSMSEIVPFLIDALGLTVDKVMERAHAWGVPLPEIVDALVSTGAAVNDIAAAARTAYDAALQDLAQALLDAGATAEEIGAAAVQVYEQTLEQLGTLFHQIGVTGEDAFNAVYDIGVDILNNPADFALNAALAVMKGAGYAFDDFKAALWSPLRAWTRDQLIDALGLSGFTLSEMATWMMDVLALSYGQVAEIGKRWGLPLDEIADALDFANAAAADIADALRFAGFTFDEISAWVLARSTAGADALADAAQILLDAGFDVQRVASWVWLKTGHVADTTASILRRAGLSAGQVLDWLVTVAGLGVEAAFRALHAAGYSASVAAAAAHHEGGATLANVGEWLAEHYDAGVEMTLSILDSLGAQLDVLIYVVTFVYHVTFDVATGLLGAFGYGLDDILALWPAP